MLSFLKVILMRQRILLPPLHLVVADILIVPAVHAVAEVLPNPVIVVVGPAVAPRRYATAGIFSALLKVVHAPKTLENRLTSSFGILSCLSV